MRILIKNKNLFVSLVERKFNNTKLEKESEKTFLRKEVKRSCICFMGFCVREKKSLQIAAAPFQHPQMLQF
jgi:hypothetical protein